MIFRVENSALYKENKVRKEEDYERKNHRRI